MSNLIEGLQEELNRNRELLVEYRKIPAGAFGAIMIEQGIGEAEKAIANDDTIGMIDCLKILKENK